MIFVCSIPGGDLRGPKQFPGSKYALHIFFPISKLTLWHPMELVWVNPNNLEYMVESIIDICTSNILFSKGVFTLGIFFFLKLPCFVIAPRVCCIGVIPGYSLCY